VKPFKPSILTFKGGCVALSFLGLELNESRNETAAAVISADASRICVRVIRRDEKVKIVRPVCRVIKIP
jgi:acetate kinase